MRVIEADLNNLKEQYDDLQEWLGNNQSHPEWHTKAMELANLSVKIANLSNQSPKKKKK